MNRTGSVQQKSIVVGHKSWNFYEWKYV